MKLPFTIMIPQISFIDKDFVVSFSTAQKMDAEKCSVVIDWWSLTDNKGRQIKQAPQGINSYMTREQYGKHITLRMKNAIAELSCDCVKICIHFLLQNGTSATAFYTYQRLNNKVIFKKVDIDKITENESITLIEQLKKADELEKQKNEEQAQKQEQNHEDPLEGSNDDLSTYMNAVFKEMLFLRNNGGRRYKVTNGVFIQHSQGMFIYSFDLEAELYIADDSPVTLIVGIVQTPGVVLMCESFKIIIAFEKMLSWEKDLNIPKAEISVEPWKLLEKLNTRLRSIDRTNKIALMLMNEGPKLAKNGDAEKIIKGQRRAFDHAVTNPITVIWGPPGTGKTYTMAKIAGEFLRQHKKVLIVSHSNVSVDNVAKQIYKTLKSTKLSVLFEKSKILRYGYVRDEELQKNEYVSSFNATIKNSSGKEEYDKLQNEYNLLREEANISNNKEIEKKLFDIHEKIKTIRVKHKAEEKKLVSKAYLVATTVSKIYADSLFDNKKYDVVMFDEVSMAYIPQIICAASFAEEHLICVGDFRQLAPIVQDNGAKKLLGKDIFEYLNISKGFSDIRPHPWLIMLDKQRRMHPDIALFPSAYIYNHLLKNDESVLSNRDHIVNSSPFTEHPMNLINTYGTTAFGNKNEDNSRFNILSAVIAFVTALKSENGQNGFTDVNNEEKVGIITPYAAQTRLIKAMIQDYRHSRKTNVSCATVHQFQGSERNVVIFDAVENYPFTKAGWLMSKNDGGSVTRLINVAVTRARGKFIAIANKAFWFNKFSPDNMFRSLVKHIGERGNVLDYSEDSLTKYMSCMNLGSNIKIYTSEESCKNEVINDIKSAKQRVTLLIPKGRINEDFGKCILDELVKLRFKTIEVNVIYDSSVIIPSEYDKISLPSDKITMPILFVDNKIWYGLPIYNYECGDKNNSTPVMTKIMVKFTGKYTVDMIKSLVNHSPIQEQASSHFKEHIKENLECRYCGGKVRLIGGDKHFIKCQDCGRLSPLTVKMVNDYLTLNDGRCPRCGRDQEAKDGPYGIYVKCSNGDIYDLDSI